MDQWTQMLHKWQNLTITNDVMFGMVMENRQICLALLQRAVPELRITKIGQLTTQKQVTGTIAARTSRFDVHVRDDHHRTFVLEMQIANRHNLPVRLRYYQSQLDYDIVRVGELYNKLKQYPTYVLAFCGFDYYGRGLVKYEFENRCRQDLSLAAGDGQHKIIFNAQAADFHDNIGIAGFLKLMRNQVDPRDQLVQDIVTEMQQIKEDPERRRRFMTYEMNMMDARQEGLDEGLREGRNEGLSEGKIAGTVKTLAKYEPDEDKALATLMAEFQLSREDAVAYWNEYR